MCRYAGEGEINRKDATQYHLASDICVFSRTQGGMTVGRARLLCIMRTMHRKTETAFLRPYSTHSWDHYIVLTHVRL